MAVVDPVVTVWFDLPAQASDLFTIEHPTLGALDTGGVLAGDLAYEISDRGYQVSIRRGRSNELDEITTGTCQIGFRNNDRAFDPAYTGGDFFPNIVPGKRVQVSVYGVTIFDGSAEDWENAYSADRRTDSSVLCIDALGLLARKDFDEWTTTGGQTAGPRIDDSLDRSEVLYAGGRDIDTGVSTLQADLVTWGSNVLNYLQLVAKSDLGRLFASRTGVLTYRDRLSLASASPRLGFADDGTGYAFSGIETTSGSQFLYTRVGVDREGGIQQTATDPAAVELYGTRTLSLGGLLLNSDIQSDDLAEWLLGIYKDPVERVSALTIMVSGYESEADQALVTSLEIGDVVNLVWTPARVGSPLELLLVVEGVSHELGVGSAHVMTLQLTPVSQTALFTIEDPVLGQLDGFARLAF